MIGIFTKTSGGTFSEQNYYGGGGGGFEQTNLQKFK